MARHETVIDARPEEVFELLADPRTYSRWVMGSRRIRAADEGWPQPGTGFDHTVGLPPLTIDDETVVLEADPPHLLRLHVRARPLPSAVVSITLRPEGERTRVTMVEDFAHPLVNLAAGPVVHGLLRLRNAESLRRLRTLAAHPERRPTETLPHRGPDLGWSGGRV